MVDAAMLFPISLSSIFLLGEFAYRSRGKRSSGDESPRTPEKLIAVSFFERRSEDGAMVLNPFIHEEHTEDRRQRS